MPLLIAIIASVAVLCLVIYLIRAHALRPSEARLHHLSTSRTASVSADGTILRRGSSAIPAIERLLDARGTTERWGFDLERANLTLRPIEYLLMRLLMAGFTFFIVILLLRNPVGFVLAGAFALLMFMVPSFWVNTRIKRRVRGIEGQLVETLTLMASSQRAGFAFAQAVELAAQRMGAPISLELNRVLLDLNLGASTEDALLAMNERVQSEDLDLVVTAILIHRQTGGNLAEILDNVTETMRDRERIKGEIKTLTASQRFSGFILCAWPLLLAAIFTAINPGMMSLMWTTTAGIVMIVLWIVLNALGIFTMRRILAIDI